MVWKDINSSKRFLIAAVLGGVLGIVAAVFVRPYLARQAPATAEDDPEQALTSPGPDLLIETPAWQYARAYQLGDWDTVIAKTLWMQERLAFVRAHPEDGMQEDEALEALQAELQVRDKAKNRITSEGVEDQYVFKTDAVLEMVGQDAGMDTLAQPAAQRSWIRVTYPLRVRALLDQEGLPVKSLLVGVNTTAEGFVLKASVVGNVEIAYDSLTYTWEEP